MSDRYQGSAYRGNRAPMDERRYGAPPRHREDDFRYGAPRDFGPPYYSEPRGYSGRGRRVHKAVPPPRPWDYSRRPPPRNDEERAALEREREAWEAMEAQRYEQRMEEQRRERERDKERADRAQMQRDGWSREYDEERSYRPPEYERPPRDYPPQGRRLRSRSPEAGHAGRRRGVERRSDRLVRDAVRSRPGTQMQAIRDALRRLQHTWTRQMRRTQGLRNAPRLMRTPHRAAQHRAASTKGLQLRLPLDRVDLATDGVAARFRRPRSVVARVRGLLARTRPDRTASAKAAATSPHPPRGSHAHHGTVHLQPTEVDIHPTVADEETRTRTHTTPTLLPAGTSTTPDRLHMKHRRSHHRLLRRTTFPHLDYRVPRRHTLLPQLPPRRWWCRTLVQHGS